MMSFPRPDWRHFVQFCTVEKVLDLAADQLVPQNYHVQKSDPVLAAVVKLCMQFPH